MPKLKNQKTPLNQTKKDSSAQPPPRRYHLTPRGLASLRTSILQAKPWLRATGPRTSEGKARSSLNALKHGDRTADRIAARRESWELIRIVRAEASEIEPELISTDRRAIWVDRIRAEIETAQHFEGSGSR